MPPSTAPLQARVQRIIPHNPSTLTFWLDSTFPYKSGQSLQVNFPGDDKKRYYSISSSPSEAGHVAFTVKAELSTPLAQSLSGIKIGDVMTVSGPWGSFGLPETIREPLYFLAGGTGVTPFRSMIKFILDKHLTTQLKLFHSAKSATELIFREEFNQWLGLDRFVPIVTREITGWDGASGRISEELLRRHLKKSSGIFLLCGPSTFVTDMEHLLQEKLAIPPAQIRREQW